MLDREPRSARRFCFVMGIIYWIFILWIPILMTKKETPSASQTSASFSLFSILLFSMSIASAIAGASLAKKLNRNGGVWGFACFFFSGLFSLILAFLGTAIAPFRFESSYKPGSYSMDKRCSNCGRSVSLSSMVGQRCPHCGAYWSYENRR